MSMFKSNHRSSAGAVFIALLILWAGGLAVAQKPLANPAQPALPADMSKLADGVYVQVVSPDGDAVSNSGIIVLESGVLLFDSHFTPEAGEALQEKIKAVTPRPVRYIVNSHFHSDHTHGNQSFPTVRQIIGSTDTRRDMLQRDLASLNQAQMIAQKQVEQLSKEMHAETDKRRLDELRAQMNQRTAFMQRMSLLRILAPGITADDTLSLIDTGREIDLLCPGQGHTQADLVLFLPQDKIAFLGDLFFHDAIPNVEDARMLEWMNTLREVLKMDAKTFVPGHGQVGARSDVEEFLKYFEDLKDLVEPAVTRGDTLEQVVGEQRLPAKYSNYSFQNFFPSNLQKMYAEIKAAKAAAAEAEAVKKQGYKP